MTLGENNEIWDEDEEARLVALESLRTVTYEGRTFGIYTDKVVSGDRVFISVSVISIPEAGTYRTYVELGCFYDLTRKRFYPLQSCNLTDFKAFLRDYQVGS